jgi:hypothetical protein
MGKLVELGIRMGLKLLTEAFISKVAVLSAWEAARRTAPVFDDEIVKAAAETLGVKLPEA